EIHGKGDVPSKRSGHSATVYRDFLIIFGGHDDTGRKNQVYELNLLTHKWRLVKCEGQIPTNRSGAPAVLKDRYMYIFGGFDGQQHFNELYSYDCWKNVWKKLEPKGGIIPKKRWYHAI